MNVFLLRIWISIKESMWFVPTLLTVVSAIIALVLIEVDNTLVANWQLSWLFNSRNPDAARTILATIASSMITIAGVAFSINLVVLTLASSQYGPRLLRNFIRDRGIQIVLGTFVSTFVYSLIVLLSIRTGEDGRDLVPQLAVAFAFVLALASLGLLIYFINHTSVSIQAESVIKSAYNDLTQAIHDLFPEQKEYESSAGDQNLELPAEDSDHKWRPLHSNKSGYIQAFDHKTFLRTCRHHDLVVKLRYQVGDFIVAGEEIALIYTKEACSRELKDKITNCIIIGSKRTPEQEIEFPINQMAEIAVRALSPGINDPHTAITCIHWLGAALVRLSKLEFPAKHLYDDEKNIRIIRKVHDFERLVDFCFGEIRLHAAGNVYVSIHILKALSKVLLQCKKQEYIDKLYEMGEAVLRVNHGKVKEPRELDLLRSDFEKLRKTLPASK